MKNNITKIENSVINPAIAETPVENNSTDVTSCETAAMPEKGIEEQLESKTMFDYDLLFSRPDEELDFQPKVILQEKVDAIKHALKGPYCKATLSFHQDKSGTLFIKLLIANRLEKKLWCAADKDLCFAVMCAIRGKFELLNSYSADGRKAKCSRENLVLEILKDLLKTRLRVLVGRDYVSQKGKIYKKFTIHLSKACIIYFNIEDSEELNNFLKTV